MRRASLPVALGVALLAPAAALGHEVLHSVEHGRAVALEVSYADGEAMAYVPFEVFGPADPKVPWQKGRTDRRGWLSFVPESPGAWRVKVADEGGHGLDTVVQVPAPGGAAEANAGAGPSGAALALRPLLGLAAVGAVFGGLILVYRKGRGA